MSAGAIARAAGLLLLGSLASRLLGLGREQVIAALYGASATTSAFATAATIPTMIYDLLIGGAVTAALVPVFSQYRRTGAERDLGQVMGTLLLLGGLGLALLSVGVVLAAPLLVGLLAPGQEPALFAQTVLFAQLVGPSVIFLGLAGVTGALLMACDRFGYTALAQSAYNGGIILGALLLSPVLGPAALCVGVLGGSALQLLLQLLGLRGLSLRLGVAFGHPGLRQIVRLYAPVAAGLVVSQIGVAIDRHLAWQTGEESVAVMRFATTLVQLPLGLVGTATGLAVLPVLSRLSAENPAEQAAFADEAQVIEAREADARLRVRVAALERRAAALEQGRARRRVHRFVCGRAAHCRGSLSGAARSWLCRAHPVPARARKDRKSVV